MQTSITWSNLFIFHHEHLQALSFLIFPLQFPLLATAQNLSKIFIVSCNGPSQFWTNNNNSTFTYNSDLPGEINAQKVAIFVSCYWLQLPIKLDDTNCYYQFYQLIFHVFDLACFVRTLTEMARMILSSELIMAIPSGSEMIELRQLFLQELAIGTSRLLTWWMWVSLDLIIVIKCS